MLGAVRSRLNSHASLLRTAISLLGTTAVTSGLGLAYWWVAARMVPAAVVGYGSSLVNAMTLVGTFGMLGMGTLLIGELEGGRRRRPRLVTACLLGSASASLVAGSLVFAALTTLSRPPFAHLAIDRVALFGVGCGLTAGTLVLDLAFVGSAAGGVQLARNAVFSAAKLALLPGLILLYGRGSDLSMLAAWVAGSAVSLVLLRTRRGRAAGLIGRPDWGALLARWRSTAAHNAFNIAGQVPRLLLPILATVLISPAAGAAFFVAWMLAGLLHVLPTHLSTALFSVGAGRLAELRPKLAFSLKVSFAVGVPAVILVSLLARPLMLLFGGGYADAATPSVRLLALSYFPMIIKTHYVAVTRVQGRLGRGAVIASLGAALEILGAWCGAHFGGLGAMSVGVCVGLAIEALIMVGTIRLALTPSPETLDGSPLVAPRRKGRHRAARTALPGPRCEVGVVDEDSYRAPRRG